MRRIEKLKTVILLMLAIMPPWQSPEANATQKFRYDCRTKTTGKPFVIVFAAENHLLGEKIGHAFVGVMRDDGAGQMSYTRWVGFYPKSNFVDMQMIFYHTDGVLSDDASHPRDIEYFVIVDDDTSTKVDAVLTEWGRGKWYNVLVQSCVSFAEKIARAAGLAAPSGSASFPDTFVKNLITKNKQSAGGACRAIND